MELIEFIDDKNRVRYKVNNFKFDLLPWIELQDLSKSRICPKCGLAYYNVQKFSYHLKKCELTYKDWKLLYKYKGIIPKCKICGNDAAWLPEHKDFGSTCNSYECFCKNSSITAKSTVEIYGDQRNPQCWTFEQIRSNGFMNRADPEYIKLLDKHLKSISMKSSEYCKIRHSSGMWGWHSEVENKLMESIKIIFPDLEREIYPPGMNGRYRMDGWIPSLNIYIEEDGEFKRDPNNSLYTPELILYIKEKKLNVEKFTKSKVKNIWEIDAWKFINNLNELKLFILSDIDQSDLWKFND